MIYKIKDDVDLEELKKYGFEYDVSEDNESPCYIKYLPDNKHALFVFDDHVIYQGEFVIIYGFKTVPLNPDWIADLMQADIIIKEDFDGKR